MSHLESALSPPDRSPGTTEIPPPVSQANDSVLVSVVIPAYRCAQYIVQGIDSVLYQSFSNHEILVVNDGSPDTAELEAESQKSLTDGLRLGPGLAAPALVSASSRDGVAVATTNAA